MADCEFLEKCPIFNRFRSEGIANVWIGKYCKGSNADCERRKLRESGGQVPVTMLPNGSYLSSLE